MTRTKVWIALSLLLLSLSLGVFAVDSSGGSPDPVRFGETVKSGISHAQTITANSQGLTAPKAEVFYSQYEYVVGYRGLSSLVETLNSDGHTMRFGKPLAVYVTAFDGTDVEPSNTSGFVRKGESSYTDWVRASEAWFVLTQPTTVVPFSSESAARSYADEHNGEVTDWDGLVSERMYARGHDGQTSTTEAMRQKEETMEEEADSLESRALSLLDREVSVTVENATSEALRRAVERAPPRTSVRLTEGTYVINETLNVTKPVSLVGEGDSTHLKGDGDGTVVLLSSPESAVSSVRITGVGNATRQTDKYGGVGEGDNWDSEIERTYGSGDAGVAVIRANSSLVHDVNITSPANGVLVRDSPDSVVTHSVVRGAERSSDGFMGVMVMRSPMLIQNSTLLDGRDAVYSHRSDGLAIRNSFIDPGRFGVHLMFTSDTYIANNTVRDAYSGIVVMTRPVGNVVVGNDVRESRSGIVTAGGDTYVARNVLVDNSYGLKIGTRTSVYEKNVMVENGVGARASGIIASNRVVSNDFVDNDRSATSLYGSLRIWSSDGIGNYWSRNVDLGSESGSESESYRPTGVVESDLRKPGYVTLSESPALKGLRSLEGTVPGMRAEGIVDQSPSESRINRRLVKQAKNDQTKYAK